MTPVSPYRPGRQGLFRLFFFLAFLGVALLFARMLQPFFTPLLLAATLTLIFYPLHERLKSFWPKSPNAVAVLMTGLIIMVVVTPLGLLLWSLIGQAAEAYPSLSNWIRGTAQGGMDSLTQSLPGFLGNLLRRLQLFLTIWNLDINQMILQNVDRVGRMISTLGGVLVRNGALLVLDLLAMMIAVFFFLRDGENMIRRVTSVIPMEDIHKGHILERWGQTLSAVVRGVFLTALAQGVLGGLGYAAVGLHFALFLGALTSLAALIPFVGALAVWAPVGFYLYAHQAHGSAWFIWLWGLLVVSTIDNFLRPLFIGKEAKLPFFLLFFGILGGIKMYGLVGLLVGPLVVASVMAFAQIYLEVFPTPAKEPSPEA